MKTYHFRGSAAGFYALFPFLNVFHDPFAIRQLVNFYPEHFGVNFDLFVRFCPDQLNFFRCSKTYCNNFVKRFASEPLAAFDEAVEIGLAPTVTASLHQFLFFSTLRPWQLVRIIPVAFYETDICFQLRFLVQQIQQSVPVIVKMIFRQTDQFRLFHLRQKSLPF